MTNKQLLEEKNALALDILASEDSNLIQLLRTMVSDYSMLSEKKITKKNYNKEMDQAEKRIKSGKFVSHKDALKRIDRL
jgi:hypothetical protein